MEIPLSASEEATLIARAQAQGTTAEALVREAIDQLLATTPQTDSAQQTAGARRPISEVIAEIMKDVPPEELAKLPTDGASEHDHYIYGWPKRKR